MIYWMAIYRSPTNEYKIDVFINGYDGRHYYEFAELRAYKDDIPSIVKKYKLHFALIIDFMTFKKHPHSSNLKLFEVNDDRLDKSAEVLFSLYKEDFADLEMWYKFQKCHEKWTKICLERGIE